MGAISTHNAQNIEMLRPDMAHAIGLSFFQKLIEDTATVEMIRRAVTRTKIMSRIALLFPIVNMSATQITCAIPKAVLNFPLFIILPA